MRIDNLRLYLHHKLVDYLQSYLLMLLNVNCYLTKQQLLLWLWLLHRLTPRLGTSNATGVALKTKKKKNIGSFVKTSGICLCRMIKTEEIEYMVYGNSVIAL